MKIKNKDKKKNKDMNKQDMPEFKFKQFSAEEDRIYAETVGKFREAISQGKTLRQAYESCPVTDKELEKLIQVDFLKIMIAERHFAQRQPLEDLAKAFDVSLGLLKDTLARMLQEVGVTASQQSAAETQTDD
jgi:hypothetical protein